jgi:hypothetical protein
LFFAILSLMAPIFVVMALVDFGDLVSTAPIRQLSAKIGFVHTQIGLSMGKGSASAIGGHSKNTLYLDGYVEGFLIPANIYTAPTDEELREGRSAILGYYDNRVDCREDGGEDWTWDTRHKTLYQGPLADIDQSPNLPLGNKCYQVVSAAIDGTEYFSLWGFRGQIMLSALAKLGIAAIFPMLWWFVANNAPVPLTPARRGFTPGRVDLEDFR